MADFNIQNVKDNNAVGNGTADDTGPINTTIENVYNAGGGIVYCPIGDYLTTSPLIMYPNVTLIGAGRNVTTISYQGSGAAIQFNDGATFANVGKLSLMYIGTGTNETAISLTNNQNCDMTDLYISGFYTGISFSSTTGQCICNNVDSTSVYSCYYGLQFASQSNNATQFNNIKNSTFSNTNVQGGGASGSTGIVVTNSDNNFFTGNAFMNLDIPISVTGSSNSTIICPRFSYCNNPIEIDQTSSSTMVIGSTSPVQSFSNSTISFGDDFLYNSFMKTGAITGQLPPAGSTLRGKMIRVLGDGATFADHLFICQELSNGTYEWVQMDGLTPDSSGSVQITRGSTAPTSPQLGDEWYDTTNNTKSYWNGTSWVAV